MGTFTLPAPLKHACGGWNERFALTHALHCKFCQKPISVTVDDDYAKLGDPYKILPLACCNRCGDLREQRRALTDRVRRAANAFGAIHHPSENTVESARKGIGGLCKKYAELIAEWHNKDGCCWDEAVVETILANPNQWGEVLGRLWTMYRQWAKEQETQAEAMML